MSLVMVAGLTYDTSALTQRRREVATGVFVWDVYFDGGVVGTLVAPREGVEVVE